jgi:protein-S-isoprenylcysteine O-methyltransferase Ste14
MHLLVFENPFYWIMIGCWVAWGISEWGHQFFIASKDTRSNNKYSTAVIYVSIFLFILIEDIILGSIQHIPQFLAFNTLALPFFIIGFMMVVSSLILRWTSVHIMGEAFSRQIRTTENQQIIKSGPFAYIRHPNYFASLLMFVGLGLLLGTWISLAVSLILGLMAYTYRIHTEEKFLRKNLTGYNDYCREVKYRLIPFIY